MHRRGFFLLALVLCVATPALAQSARYLYAAFNDGSLHVYDIDNGHREIQSFRTVGGVTDVRGVCASAATGTFYMAHQTTNAGYVIAVDLYSNTVLWDKKYQPGVDRLSCTPDGRKLYIPCHEAFTDACVIVADAATGAEVTRIHVSPRPHDCLSSLSGDRVYIETKSSAFIEAIDTGSSGAQNEALAALTRLDTGLGNFLQALYETSGETAEKELRNAKRRIERGGADLARAGERIH